MFIRSKKRQFKPYFGEKTCFQPLILQKKHKCKLIRVLIVGGELMSYEEEEEDWTEEENEDEDRSWLDDDW